MKVHYTQSALSALNTLPRPVRKALYRKVGFLLQDLRHPSLHAKKYDESRNLWQARVTLGWRFFFRIVDNAYLIEEITPHPK